MNYVKHLQIKKNIEKNIKYMINNTIFSKTNKKIQTLNKLLKSKKERIQNNKIILLGEKLINAYLENSIEKSIDVFT